MPEGENGTPQPDNDPVTPWAAFRPGCLIAIALLVVLPGGCFAVFDNFFQAMEGDVPEWEPRVVAVGTIALTVLLLVAARKIRLTQLGGWGGWWSVRDPGVSHLQGPAGAETDIRLAPATPVLVREREGEYLRVRVGPGPRTEWVHQESLSRK